MKLGLSPTLAPTFVPLSQRRTDVVPVSPTMLSHGAPTRQAMTTLTFEQYVEVVLAGHCQAGVDFESGGRDW